MNALDRKIASRILPSLSLIAHKHSADSSTKPICYSGSVAVQPYTEENRAAHGCIEETDTCTCGATRRVLTNGRHVEYAPWSR